MSLLRNRIDAILPTAIGKVVINTSITQESHKWAKEDTRSAEIRKAEKDLQALDGNNADASILSRVLGAEIKAHPPVFMVIKPQFLTALVSQDFTGEADPDPVVPFGTVVLVTNTKVNHLRAGDKDWKFPILYTSDWRIATEDEIKTAVTALFDARPALTLKLFGVKFDNEVQATDGGQED